MPHRVYHAVFWELQIVSKLLMKVAEARVNEEVENLRTVELSDFLGIQSALLRTASESSLRSVSTRKTKRSLLDPYQL